MSASSSMSHPHFQRFPAVPAGATISVVAPSGPFDLESFARGVEKLRQHYEVQHTPRIFEAKRYLAGSDEARARELQDALESNSSALIAARGGYGLTRIVDRIDLKAAPLKALIGFSDFTALHLLAQQHGWQSIHAPVVTQLGNQPDIVFTRLRDLLAHHPVLPLSGTRTIFPGIAEGPLLGGNLAVLTRHLGTPFLPSFDGAVVVLEDIAERPYQLDRLLTHMRQSRVFDRAAGFVLGDFTDCEQRSAAFTADEVLAELLSEFKKPCAAGFSIGHGAVNTPVTLGASVRLDAQAATLQFLSE
jgi:muramoyltetrapeptide carboxypeptidase